MILLVSHLLKPSLQPKPATETNLPTNNANSLKENRKYLVGVALLSGALLL